MKGTLVLNRELFIVGIVGYGALSCFILTSLIMHGHAIWGATLTVVVSPVAIALVWWLFQKWEPSPRVLLALGHVSWAAIFGDLIFLPAVMALAAVGWSKTEHMWWFWRSSWWTFISLAIGFGVGLVFHYVIGGRADSNSPDLGERLHDAPLSWFHNLGIFPALTGTAICVLVPLLSTAGSRRLGVIALLVGLIGWGTLQAADIWRSNLPTASAYSLDPNWTNVPYDWWNLQPQR